MHILIVNHCNNSMTEVEPVLDFASSGRSGRRNALPDILGSPAGVNPGDLPLKLAELQFYWSIRHLEHAQIRAIALHHFNIPEMNQKLFF
uniref:Uncharacterized protein n=1 Tax=Sander lucioperca TaxID=283035 RepID=A0A8C9X2X7_SANLU